jgi:hypothetical protein
VDRQGATRIDPKTSSNCGTVFGCSVFEMLLLIAAADQLHQTQNDSASAPANKSLGRSVCSSSTTELDMMKTHHQPSNHLLGFFPSGADGTDVDTDLDTDTWYLLGMAGSGCRFALFL